MRGLWLGLVGVLVSAAVVWSAEPVYDRQDGQGAAIAGVGLSLFSAGLLLDRDYSPLTPAEISALDARDLNWLDRTAVENWSPRAGRASDYLVASSALVPLTLMLGEPARDQADVLGLMYVETMVATTGLTYLLKNAFGRPRPFVYGDNPDIPESLRFSRTARRSFPSGHTATAFAAMVFTASVYARLYPSSSARYWVWGGCLAAASTTGYLRYTAGMHFPTDILAGATVGAAAGWLIPDLHKTDPVTGGKDGGVPVGQVVWGLTLGY